ncbi:MAG: hypothetical protein R2741_07025 [Methanolobus sp.]
MEKIEFIGASGAGKTTLFKQLLSERHDSKAWSTPQEARINIAMQQKDALIRGNLLRFIGYNLYFLFKRNPHFRRAALEKLLIEKYADIFSNNAADYNCLFELLLDSWCGKTVQYLKPYNLIHFCQFYESILIRDLAILNFFSYDGVVVYEDGIMHNSIGLENSNAYEKIMQLPPENRKQILPCGIIYCNLPLEENILRRKKRIASGNITSLELNYNEDELRDLCNESCVSTARVVDLMRDLDVPILEIDMTKSNDENIDLIISFIDKIKK